MSSFSKTTRPPPRSVRCVLSLCLLLPLMMAAPFSLGRDLPEHQVKAAFLFNFASFVHWPDSLFKTPATPLRFCILEAEAVSQTLEQLIAGESLDGRPLELMRLKRGRPAPTCHILFLSARNDIRAFLSSQWQGEALTVGDSASFIEAGGMIALLRKRKRIRPVVNLDALEASALRLSSKLLRLAIRVRPGQAE